MAEKTPESKVKEIKEVAEKALTEWECDFIESIDQQIKNGRQLSPKQIAIIDKCYLKVCESPY